MFVDATALNNKWEELLNLYVTKRTKEIEDSLKHQGIGDIEWACEVTSRSKNKLIDTILIPFKTELEGDIVHYPTKRGVPYEFNKPKFIEFIHENFSRIERS